MSEHTHTWQYMEWGPIINNEVGRYLRFVCECGESKLVKSLGDSNLEELEARSSTTSGDESVASSKVFDPPPGERQ